jgi:phenolic acid decarboxylase
MKNVFLVLVVLALVFAQGPSEGLKQNVIEMQYEKIACRANFHIEVMKLVKEKLNASVDDEIAAVKSDLEALKAAADAGNRSKFNVALKEIANDLKKNVITYRKLLAGLKWSPKKQFVDDFLAAKKKMTDCFQNASVGLGKAQREYVNAWIENAKNVTQRLENKGLNMSGLKEIIGEAKEKLAKLDEAIATGNGTVVHEAANEIRGEHLHLWARFHVERMSILLQAISSRAIERGLSADVEEIKSLLESAREKIMVGKAYENGEFEEIEKSLKSAAEKLRELFKKIKSEE